VGVRFRPRDSIRTAGRPVSNGPRTMPTTSQPVKPLAGSVLGPSGTLWEPVRLWPWYKWAASEAMWAGASLLYGVVARTREDARGGPNG